MQLMTDKAALPPRGGWDDILTSEILVDLEAPRELSLSPDGRHVAYTLEPATKSGAHQVSSLWIADIGRENSARPLTLGGAKDENPKWSPDGGTLAFISDRANGGNSSAIYIVSVKTDSTDERAPVSLTEASNKKYISSLAWSPDGESIAYLSADESAEEDDPQVYSCKRDYLRLRCIDISTGAVNTLFEEPRNVQIISWNSESSEIALVLDKTSDLNSPNYDGVQLARLSPKTRDVTYLTEFPRGVVGMTWFRQDIYFLAGTSPERTEVPTMVWKCSANHSKQAERVKYGKEDSVSNIRWASRSPTVQIQRGLTDEICFLSESSTMYSTECGISSWDTLSIGDAHRFVLVVGLSSSRCPTEVYSVRGKDLTQLSNHGQFVNELDLSDAFPFYAAAKDGTSLDGVMYVPSPIREKPWATIVTLHGGPYYRDNLNFYVPGGTSWAAWLANAGYAVLSVNYRGSSGRGEEFASTGRGRMGTNDYDDVISMVEAGIDRGIIDKDRVAIGGWSQGGYLSYLAVTRSAFRFRAAVCGAGVVDWDMLTMSSDDPALEAGLAGGAPWALDSQSTQARHGSAIWHMSNKIQTPVLILHGEKDKRVPVSQAIAFYRGCMHHEINCQLIIYPREPHSFSEREHQLDVFERIRDFYDQHMI